VFAGFGKVMSIERFEAVSISVDAKPIIAGRTTFGRKI